MNDKMNKVYIPVKYLTDYFTKRLIEELHINIYNEFQFMQIKWIVDKILGDFRSGMDDESREDFINAILREW